MKKKFVLLFFILSLVKLYHIADRSLRFSPELLQNSFKINAGEKTSLGIIGLDVIPIRDFFDTQEISNYRLSKKIIENHQMFYQRMLEFNYPIKLNQHSNFLVSLKSEEKEQNCELLDLTKNFNIYECK